MEKNKTVRPWGFYEVLQETSDNVKVKTLVVEPHKSLSMQHHKDRNEYWFVVEGVASIYSYEEDTNTKVLFAHYPQFEQVWINKNTWHQLVNEQDTLLKIIEIQYGDRCVEEDIIRKDPIVTIST